MRWVKAHVGRVQRASDHRLKGHARVPVALQARRSGSARKGPCSCISIRSQVGTRVEVDDPSLREVRQPRSLMPQGLRGGFLAIAQPNSEVTPHADLGVIRRDERFDKFLDKRVAGNVFDRRSKPSPLHCVRPRTRLQQVALMRGVDGGNLTIYQLAICAYRVLVHR